MECFEYEMKCWVIRIKQELIVKSGGRCTPWGWSSNWFKNGNVFRLFLPFEDEVVVEERKGLEDHSTDTKNDPVVPNQSLSLHLIRLQLTNVRFLHTLAHAKSSGWGMQWMKTQIQYQLWIEDTGKGPSAADWIWTHEYEEMNIMEWNHNMEWQ